MHKIAEAAITELKTILILRMVGPRQLGLDKVAITGIVLTMFDPTVSRKKDNNNTNNRHRPQDTVDINLINTLRAKIFRTQYTLINRLTRL